MLAAAGDIQQPYSPIGLVFATISKTPQKAGCLEAPAIPIEAGYREATDALIESARLSGGDAVIHVNFDYRMATAAAGCNATTPSFEIYAWGTAVKLD